MHLEKEILAGKKFKKGELKKKAKEELKEVKDIKRKCLEDKRKGSRE